MKLNDITIEHTLNYVPQYDFDYKPVVYSVDLGTQSYFVLVKEKYTRMSCIISEVLLTF